MKTKSIQLEVPDYVSIEQYANINSYSGDDNLGKLIHTVSKITGEEVDEVKKWSLDSMKKVADIFADIADHNEQFHSIIEWNGELLGYSSIKQASLGEYLDLESLAKDLQNNMHKIAAIFYRPITKHRFNSLKFLTKQRIKIANNDVEDVFDWYEVEEYDSKKRKLREESFKNFPVHIFLGALSFFLTNANQYLNSIAYSQNQMTKEMMEKKNNILLGSLLLNTGAGGGLSISSVNPIYYQYQGVTL